MNIASSNYFNVSKNKYKLKDKLIFLLYSLYFILKPFYFWKSGLPQISDFILVLLMIVYFISNKFSISFNKRNVVFLKNGLLFVTWIIFVNGIWALRLQTTESFILQTLYYLYNFLTASIVVSLYSQYKEKIIEITYKSVLLSVIIQTVNYFVNGGFSGGRITGSFNNPNQLGYYSLLMIAFLMFISYHLKVSFKWFIIVIILSMILNFASLSKAAIISSLGLVFLYFFSKNKNKSFKRKLILILIFVLLLSVVIYNTTQIIQNNSLINSVQRRIQNIGKDSDDNLEGRGYYRIYEYPEYWLFGAGEGEYSRFRYGEIEFHSTLGNIQVSYGLVGILLFINLMRLALKNDRYRSWYILFMIMLYGLTHNGIRNSLFWILLALMASVQHK